MLILNIRMIRTSWNTKIYPSKTKSWTSWTISSRICLLKSTWRAPQSWRTWSSCTREMMRMITGLSVTTLRMMTRTLFLPFWKMLLPTTNDHIRLKYYNISQMLITFIQKHYNPNIYCKFNYYIFNTKYSFFITAFIINQKYYITKSDKLDNYNQ